MSISRYDRNPGTVSVRLAAPGHAPGTSRFAARPAALSILFGLGFLCALAALFSPRATVAQADISVTTGDCPVGDLVVSPSVGSADNYIRGVAAIGPNDAWAVGHYPNASGINQTLTMHWDGAEWQVVPSPNVGSYGNYLYAVSATSSGEVWAVGHYLTNTQRTLTMRWDGSQWNIVGSPNNGQLSNNLRGVSVVSPTNVWAVGFYFSNNNVDRTLTLHWNGTQWNLIPSPDVGPGTNRLFSVSADSTGSAWAVGNYSPSASGSFFTLAMRWDGTGPEGGWTIFSTPNPGGDYNLLIGVFSLSSDEAWAVGFSTDGNNDPTHTLTTHWDGNQWSQVASPGSNLTENYLYSVTGTSSTDVWAAGYAYNSVGFEPGQALGLHWDGTQWTVASSAIAGTTTNTLFGVTALSPGRAITGGVSRSGGNNPLRTFSLLYMSDCSSPTAATTPLPSNTPLPSYTPTRTGTQVSTRISTSTNTAVPPSATYTNTPGEPTATIAPNTPGPPSATHTNTPIPSTETPTGITATATATTCTLEYIDVPATNTFYTFIRCLSCRGIVSGYDDGAFRPDNDITRGQIAKMVSSSAGFEEDPGPQIYEDVPIANPFYAWINRLSMRGHLGGYICGTVPEEPCISPDNRPYFRPNATATRGQLAKIVSNAAGLGGTPAGLFYIDVQEDQPFYVWIMRLTGIGAMSGYPCGTIPEEPCDETNRPYFRPFNNVTRGQASKIVANSFFQSCNTP
jgi:hypothetical protein